VTRTNFPSSLSEYYQCDADNNLTSKTVPSRLAHFEFCEGRLAPGRATNREIRNTKNYFYFLDVHLKPTFGAHPLCDIKRETVQSFLAAKLSGGLAWKTVKEIRGVLSRALGAAEQWEYINDNQARKTRLPRRPLRLAPRPVLAPEQIRQLAAKLAEPAKSIEVLLVLTGLRVGEFLALRWKNIDLAGRTVRVTETVYDGHFDTPKTQRSDRVIPIGDEASSCPSPKFCQATESIAYSKLLATDLV